MKHEYKKLPPAIIDSWTKALGTNKYEQGRGYLNKGDKFCVLGVLADMMVGEWKKSVCYGDCDYLFIAKANTEEAPNDNDINLEAYTEETWCPDMPAQMHLTRMNDGKEGNHKHSFLELAVWIRENLAEKENVKV